jgi:thiamine biosynthesis lipoprotein
MSPCTTAGSAWLRRARPLLGTLVELGVPAGTRAEVLAAGFGALEAVQAALSRFDADSDVSRFAQQATHTSLALRPAGQRVLRAAQALRQASGGLFDISLGSGPQAWHVASGRLHKQAPQVRLDLGGIAKGFAVDQAVRALHRAGCAAGWVNAGGDLRVFGKLSLPLVLRDEAGGGTRPIGQLADGAFATSHFAPGSRAQLQGASMPQPVTAHVSVAAPRALWADALTKIVALSGDAAHPLLARLGARAWLH